MNKKILFITGTSLALVAGLTLWSPVSLSEPLTCEDAYTEKAALMNRAWGQNLQSVLDQEIPVSEMVDDAFEGARTYRCWMEYLCRSVSHSISASPLESAGTGLHEEHIGVVPGCADPEDLEIPGTQISYIPQCSGAPSDDFLNCVKMMQRQFGERDGATGAEPVAAEVERMREESVVYVKLERALREAAAEQRTRAVGTKLREILVKMRGMEDAALTVKNLFEKLNSLLPCYVRECT